MKNLIHLLISGAIFVLCGAGCGESQPYGQPSLRGEKIPGVPFPAGTDVNQHYVFGMPKTTDKRHRFTQPNSTVPAENHGLTVLKKKAFTIGHYDKYKVPAWVAMRWTAADLERSKKNNIDRGDWRMDRELPKYARAGTDYEFAKYHYERGHMARNRDLRAWGAEAVREGMTMSNAVPQKKDHGHVVWGALEDSHRGIVNDSKAGVKTLWIISGPVLRDNKPEFTVGNGVGVPYATYKVMGWVDTKNKFHVRAYLIPQEANKSDPPSKFLTSVDNVEQLTGLDFFHELPDDVEDNIESKKARKMWAQ